MVLLMAVVYEFRTPLLEADLEATQADLEAIEGVNGILRDLQIDKAGFPLWGSATRGGPWVVWSREIGLPNMLGSDMFIGRV